MTHLTTHFITTCSLKRFILPTKEAHVHIKTEKNLWSSSIVFTDRALKYLSSSTKILHFSSTGHLRKCITSPSLKMIWKFAATSFTPAIWNRLMLCISIDFFTDKGSSSKEMWWSSLGVIIWVCVFEAASLYLSAGRPMTSKLLLSFQ